MLNRNVGPQCWCGLGYAGGWGPRGLALLFWDPLIAAPVRSLHSTNHSTVLSPMKTPSLALGALLSPPQYQAPLELRNAPAFVTPCPRGWGLCWTSPCYRQCIPSLGCRELCCPGMVRFGCCRQVGGKSLLDLGDVLGALPAYF